MDKAANSEESAKRKEVLEGNYSLESPRLIMPGNNGAALQDAFSTTRVLYVCQIVHPKP
jgi:hypothetical protein